MRLVRAVVVSMHANMIFGDPATASTMRGRIATGSKQVAPVGKEMTSTTQTGDRSARRRAPFSTEAQIAASWSLATLAPLYTCCVITSRV